LSFNTSSALCPRAAGTFASDRAFIHSPEERLDRDSATIFTNANETFNDDTYEYDEIALPFLRHLGKAIYEIELQRERPRRPDLGRYQVARD